MKSSILRKMRDDSPGMSALEAGRTFDLVMGSLRHVIEHEGEAMVPGLGKFRKKFQQGRKGRNPRTGDPVNIPGRDVIKFKETRPAKG